MVFAEMGSRHNSRPTNPGSGPDMEAAAAFNHVRGRSHRDKNPNRGFRASGWEVPTLWGVAAAKSADMQGGREYLRAAFLRSWRVRRERPPDATPKIAEK